MRACTRGSKVRLTPDGGCGKRAYTSRAKARKAAKLARHIGLRPYKCPRCGAWHLTSHEIHGAKK